MDYRCHPQAIATPSQSINGATEAAIHAFFTYQAGLLGGPFGSHHRLQGILLERASVLVFLIVAVAVGIVECQVQFPQGIESLTRISW
jgi:hypothetical protein